jgi:hypothetical protein
VEIEPSISSQFPAPTQDRLMQSYGDSSPMGLLWTFMGASEPYTMFVGFAEMISGILLFPLNGSEITARLRRSDERRFLLTDRGFHWINEFPFN